MTVFRYVGAVALLALAAPAAARAAEPACGATITTSTRLHADLANCPGNGLVIGADGITLDLGRSTLSGAGTGIVLAGHRGVTISGGTIKGFATGVALDGADGNRVRGVTLTADLRPRHRRGQRQRRERLRGRRLVRQPDGDRDHGLGRQHDPR